MFTGPALARSPDTAQRGVGVASPIAREKKRAVNNGSDTGTYKIDT